MSAFDYSKWNNIELSDDEEDVHPNIDKDSWFRLKHRERVEREEDEIKERRRLEERLGGLRRELDAYASLGIAAQEHLKARKLQDEIAALENTLAEMERKRKWNADNMCKTVESRSLVSEARPAPGPEPRLRGEAVAEGYCEFVEQHEDLLERYIALDSDDLEAVLEFLREHGGTLLQGEHAESYLLLDCLEKEMNGEHAAMLSSARLCQLLTQLREFSRASGRPARDGVQPVMSRLLDHEPTREAFEEAVADFARRVERRAPEKKREMDAERAERGEETGEESDGENPPGPGGLDPLEVLRTLPAEMRRAFEAQDVQRLQAAVDALPDDEARYHLKRCEDSGLWVPNPDQGPPPYRQ